MPALAIVSALLDEQRGLLEQLSQTSKHTRAGRTFWRGKWGEQDVVLVLSRVGKVAAASTATTLIEAFGVGIILFTGVAGGLGEGVAVGDVVVAREFIQHDMDSSPLFERFEIPLYGRARLPCDGHLTDILLEASKLGLESAGSHFHRENLIHAPQVHFGLIASGDQFVSSAEAVAELLQSLGNAGHMPLAVEMEGAAIAQVCFDYGVPFAAMRTVSDRADDDAHVDFSAFVQQVASPYALAIVREFMHLLRQSHLPLP
ncbi:MAG: 5'-methylthioadenosine/adenosylhomocysteine nucleosidase [Rhodoferax sp.]|uniref:5'-methylthioadenosine/adenosylhomocysteine nucleosidase n=1 Tax=Rhodoferax sp. TaxID=50421 RepID=UPI001B749A29|nr:5'-methylthioadenosine/adenosylhomocysteine nucleosidase [Rhodoferax sp.]MBP9147375.1 5'-methylthioadenosine/adenosylhomocysteine nucleosidase [Rhodoferax sp.]MBP9736481.1 5'-methylthioadenosine/adenosylhomocysteine nucleosidase [Rhodoferax sp.]